VVERPCSANLVRGAWGRASARPSLRQRATMIEPMKSTLPALLPAGCAPMPEEPALSSPNSKVDTQAPSALATRWITCARSGGTPYQTSRSIYAGTTSDWWEYCTFGNYGCAAFSTVHFVDGKVYAIHQ
jgi:hypothetical protein